MDLFDEHLFVFLHIPKNAGTTLDRTAKQIFGRRRLRYFRASRLEGQRIEEIEDKHTRRVQWLSGHFGYAAEFLDRFKKRHLYISTLRDPIDRIVSYYSYQVMKAQKDPSDYRRKVQGMSLDQFCGLLLEKGHFLSGNNQCQLLGVPETLHLAQETLRQRYFLLTTVNGVNRACEMLDRQLGEEHQQSHPERSHRNPSQSRSYALDSTTEKLLRARTAGDQALFEWVKAHEDAWLNCAEQRMIDLGSRGSRHLA